MSEIKRLHGLVELLQTSSREWREAHDRLRAELKQAKNDGENLQRNWDLCSRTGRKVMIQLAESEAREAKLRADRDSENEKRQAAEQAFASCLVSLQATQACEAKLREALQVAQSHSPCPLYAEALALPHDDSALKAALKQARIEVLERAGELVIGGRFLHDQAPTALFAREVFKMLKAEIEKEKEKKE
jgi:hypothetical protein